MIYWCCKLPILEINLSVHVYTRICQLILTDSVCCIIFIYAFCKIVVNISVFLDIYNIWKWKIKVIFWFISLFVRSLPVLWNGSLVPLSRFYLGPPVTRYRIFCLRSVIFKKNVSSLFNYHLNRSFVPELKYEFQFVRKQTHVIQEWKLVRNFMEQSCFVKLIVAHAAKWSETCLSLPHVSYMLHLSPFW